MVLSGAGKSLLVVKTFVLIGAITAVWRACGTVSFIVCAGIAGMSEQYFILFAFLLCCVVSFVLGTALGTAGTIGVVLAVLAQSGGIDINIVAGAIIAGAYFGDRCSPMSSSAILVAALTGTELYGNIKNMLKFTVLPLVLAIAGYAYLSWMNPLVFHDNRIANEIIRLFDLHPVVLAPAIVILAAAACRMDIKVSMGASIAAGIAVAVIIQHKTIFELFSYIVFGYHMDEPGLFAGLIKGGGILSMLNAGLIVLISSAYSGIFEGTGMLRSIERYVEGIGQRIGVFAATVLTSIASAAFGCNQTLAAILTYQFSHKLYVKHSLSKERLALDLENSVIVIAALIPWNIAGAFPAAVLSADAGFIPYAFYLLLVPLTGLFMTRSSIVRKQASLLK